MTLSRTLCFVISKQMIRRQIKWILIWLTGSNQEIPTAAPNDQDKFNLEQRTNDGNSGKSTFDGDHFPSF